MNRSSPSPALRGRRLEPRSSTNESPGRERFVLLIVDGRPQSPVSPSNRSRPAGWALIGRRLGPGAVVSSILTRPLPLSREASSARYQVSLAEPLVVEPITRAVHVSSNCL